MITFKFPTYKESGDDTKMFNDLQKQRTELKKNLTETGCTERGLDPSG